MSPLLPLPLPIPLVRGRLRKMRATLKRIDLMPKDGRQKRRLKGIGLSITRTWIALIKLCNSITKRKG